MTTLWQIDKEEEIKKEQRKKSKLLKVTKEKLLKNRKAMLKAEDSSELVQTQDRKVEGSGE